MFDFSKVYTQPINRDFILSKVSDSQIFWEYFGSFELGKVYPSKFRKDRSPSTGFYVGKTGKLIYNDIATGEKLDCFAFVAKLLNITYAEAIRTVGVDFGIISGTSSRNLSREHLNRAELVDKEIKKNTLIQIVPDRWKDEYLGYWREYEITKEELIGERVYPVKELYINKKKIYNPHNLQRYAYLQHFEGKDYMKIYSPKDKSMKWVSNIPLSVPFGIDNLKPQTDTLLITKSKKDMMVLKKIHPDVIATQNESSAALPEDIQALAWSLWKIGCIIWDNDEVGVSNCTEFNELGFTYFNIPREYYKKFKIKDPSDFVAYYGIDALQDLMKQKGII